MVGNLDSLLWYTQPIRLRLNVNSARDARKDLKVIPDSTRLPAREEGAEPVRGAQQSLPERGGSAIGMY
jgi:hypothetical protein